MRPSAASASEDGVKAKVTKKSTKSRSRTSKTTETAVIAAAAATPKNVSCVSAAGASVAATAVNSATPTTPTIPAGYSNVFDSAYASVANPYVADPSAGSRSHLKGYPGIEPRSIKCMWEQHDNSDMELSWDVCSRVAEDASYKLWQLINDIKIAARHSGEMVTYDLVNEVLKDADVPPMLGALDSEWDRIDPPHDDTFFYYADKIFELRDEYQKDVSIAMPDGPDHVSCWVSEVKNAQLLKRYIPSLIYVCLYGDPEALDVGLSEAAASPIIGSCYRVLLDKLIQILAFKQDDGISQRCWQLLSSCATNPHTRDVACRPEYFHLTEILICQLLAPYECIKNGEVKMESEGLPLGVHIKTEIDNDQSCSYDMKPDISGCSGEVKMEAYPFNGDSMQEEQIYQLRVDDDDDQDVGNANMGPNCSSDATSAQAKVSAYFASPVDSKYVDSLCSCIGHLGARNGYFQRECLYHILRRLEKFFSSRTVSSARDHNYISRAVKGLIALGEYAFKEFIPFIYKFSVDQIPENLWNDFAVAAAFLNGPDDIFLYEWLEYMCGADKLQPYMIYYARYHEKLMLYRQLKRKSATFKIYPKVTVRRLDWPPPVIPPCRVESLRDYFPELCAPNPKLNRPGNFRFKFPGCRPIIRKPKPSTYEDRCVDSTFTCNDILIARRRLYKPLSNERLAVSLSNYYRL